jgi:hypothetical protein
MKIVISSGHGLYIRGASDILDEVDEARRVVPNVADLLRASGHQVVTFNDNVSTTQDENLHRIVDFHNSQTRDLDVSVHFNAYEHNSKPMGAEVCYVTQEDVAGRLSKAIADAAQLPDRGPKYRGDLFFLNNTEMPAVLIETCFVDSTVDADHYHANFGRICQAIADVAMGPITEPEPPEDRPETCYKPLLVEKGSCSWFGGPEDSGVSPSEGLAFIYSTDQAPQLFLDEQPAGTTGLARRLDPEVFYLACRWNYDVTPKEMLDDRDKVALVMSTKTGKAFPAWPADWGPHSDTNRVADLSPGLMGALGIETDDEVAVIYPVSSRTNLKAKVQTQLAAPKIEEKPKVETPHPHPHKNPPKHKTSTKYKP